MAMAEETRRQGTRLLPKLASLAIRHADFLVVTSCILGLIAFLLLPALAKNTYISENALIPGSASPKFMLQDAVDAAQLARELQVSRHSTTNGPSAVRNFLVKYLVAMGADFYLHPFHPPDPPFSSMHFFSSQPSPAKGMKTSAKDNLNASQGLGMNIAGILRAPRGEGNEAIVLVTPFDAESLTDTDAFSLGLGLALFHLLSKAPWLAKDIIWLAADSHYGAHTAVSAWLKDYHEPAFLNGPKFQDTILHLELYYGMFDKNAALVLLEETTMGDFKRAGVIGAGLVLDLQEVQGRTLSDALTVYAEGPNGQMPNLDLINVVNNLAVYREGLHMRLDMAAGMLEWAWLHVVGQVLEKVGQMAAMLNAGWRFGLPASEYVQGAATLARSLSLQALGVPTGAHGAFRDYQIDAVTVVMSFATQAHGGHIGSLIKFGRLLEGMIRSVNNLLEKFHQSFFLYFLTGPNKFVSVGVYTIPLLLLLITLPLKAAALCAQASGSSSQSSSKVSDQMQAGSAGFFQEGYTSSFARWSFAVLSVCLVELWAFLVAISPPLANYVAETSELKVTFWFAFCGTSLCVLFVLLPWMTRVLGIPHVGSNWTAIKASTLGAATIGIGIMSSINFAAALAGAVLLVPMCLFVYPLQHLGKERGLRPFCTAMVGLAFIVIGSLPVIFVVLLTVLGESSKLSLAILWDWVECMWKWGSATYLYLLLVHLPCSVLCLLLLLCRV